MRKKMWINCLYSLMFMSVVSMPTMSSTITNEKAMLKGNEGVTIENISMYASPISIPLEVLSDFGESREGYMHQGIDVRMPIGSGLFAIMDGTVIKAAPDSKGINTGGGNIIIIDHGNGIQTWYMHLESYAVKVGQKVKKGQLIGLSGCTGDSTSPLLHFEYRINGVPVDPTFVFKQNYLNTITLDEPFVVVQS